MTRKALSVLLSIIVAMVSFPSQAVAQVFNGGAAAEASGLTAVPRINPNGGLPGLSPLSPTPALTPSLQSGLVPALNAPSIVTPNAVSVINPLAVVPALPLSVVAVNPNAVAPQVAAAVAAARSQPATPVAQLALIGEKLSAAASKGSDQSPLLDSLFTGAKQLASTLSGEPAAVAPTALTPTLSAASAPEGRATPPAPITLESMAVDPTASLPSRQAAVAQIAKSADSKEILSRVADANPQGGAADYEIHRSALKALAEQGVVKSLRPVSEAHKNEILAKLSSSKPSVAVFDYDDTLAGLKEPISPKVAAGLKASADAGVRTAILTDRPDAKKNDKDVTVLDSIASMTPEQKADLTVGSNSGARLTTFDAKGEPVIAFDAALKFTDAQAAAITAASAKTADKFGRFEYNGAEENLSAFKWVRFLPLGMPAETVEAAAAFMQAELNAAGAGVTVAGRQAADPKNPSYLTISLLDKTVGMKALREVRRYEGRTLVVGDSFFGTRTVDSDMAKAAPGALALAVGGLADPRIPNIFVWPTKGAAASAEILGALGKQTGASKFWKKIGDKIGWNAPSVKAPGPDDAINWKALGGQVVQSVVSMAAYLMVTLAFVKAATSIPSVGWLGYGVLMSLSPMAGIAAAMVIGMVVKTMVAKKATAMVAVLRVVSLGLLPLFFALGVTGFPALLVGALAEGFMLSSMMTTDGAFRRVLFPAKQLGNINGILFQMFPAVQVVLGLLLGFGHFADTINPYLVFAGASALNLFVILPMIWITMPNIRMADAPTGYELSPKSLKTSAVEFLRKYWKEAAVLAASIALFAAFTWGPIAALPFLVTYPAFKSSLPIALALVYWITRIPAFQNLRKGRSAEPSAEVKALIEKRGALAAEIATMAKTGDAVRPEIGAKEEELKAVETELGVYKGRQMKALMLMALGTMMYYPLYLVAAPHVAEILVGAASKGALAGQFLGALFMGSWISTTARTEINVVRKNGKVLALHPWMRGAVVALGGVLMFAKIVPGNLVAALIGAAVTAGLIALAKRITDRGWIKFGGLGFILVAIPAIAMAFPAALPFLGVKTAMYLALLAAGFCNGPNFVSLLTILQRSTAKSASGEVGGIQGSIFNASISVAYAAITVASAFLVPAYPALLFLMAAVNAIIAVMLWRAPKSLPGLSDSVFTKPAAKK